ncbi:response regulator [Chelativorans sp. SCAU2101]|jgi:FOG: CheY-like receiver|uniref:Response regulator n=1 Tax=Chelativorans petroleitrophicus TaxID=2975484 RepID=A0A9X3B6I4_9HYPH|nr:response regulator [Chelativorans petroleitrophicus]MCT8990578.1 response regulator [Chelativorans petroleitrophicus]
MTVFSGKLSGIRVLVVEDEALVAMDLEMILEDLGCAVVGPVMRLDRAEALVKADVEADAAILDVNVGGLQVFPLAALLAERGVPIVFATGYDSSGMPAEWNGRPTLQKPYTVEDVARRLLQAIAGA